MAIDVFAADEQSAAPVELERWSTLARSVLESRGIKGEAEVSLLFVDEDAIAALNERFLKTRRSTSGCFVVSSRQISSEMKTATIFGA